MRGAQWHRCAGSPVREIELLYRRRHQWRDAALAPGFDPLAAVAGELVDLEVELQPGTAQRVAFTLHGQTVAYDARTRRLACMDTEVELAAEPDPDSLTLRMLLDRNSIEIFADGGAVALAFSFVPRPEQKGLRADRDRRHGANRFPEPAGTGLDPRLTHRVSWPQAPRSGPAYRSRAPGALPSAAPTQFDGDRGVVLRVAHTQLP